MVGNLLSSAWMHLSLTQTGQCICTYKFVVTTIYGKKISWSLFWNTWNHLKWCIPPPSVVEAGTFPSTIRFYFSVALSWYKDRITHNHTDCLKSVLWDNHFFLLFLCVQRQSSIPDALLRNPASVPRGLHIHMSHVTGFQLGDNNNMVIYGERRRHPTAPSSINSPRTNAASRRDKTGGVSWGQTEILDFLWQFSALFLQNRKFMFCKTRTQESLVAFIIILKSSQCLLLKSAPDSDFSSVACRLFQIMFFFILLTALNYLLPLFEYFTMSKTSHLSLALSAV